MKDLDLLVSSHECGYCETSPDFSIPYGLVQVHTKWHYLILVHRRDKEDLHKTFIAPLLA